MEVKALCLNAEVPPENALLKIAMSKRDNCSNTDLLDGFLLFENMETSFSSNIWFQYFCLLNI